jgi:hypothetical protein
LIEAFTWQQLSISQGWEQNCNYENLIQTHCKEASGILCVGIGGHLFGDRSASKACGGRKYGH